ncbi:DUF2721 domain-containing protein [Leptolyngbya sp. O-77]|uniref:DUF2721 domain-containing protein n=1 Tax=Leptolyngbya sp. O-77 TaxID=1080068 RepID=UPI00074D4B89|nr:DUF2721 domain-containing protein [Leptolyngbya sp. O-77]BAU40572.1 hypothetical protein O77CONTIG1_00375 [Leptolyngbya sp. O-77]
MSIDITTPAILFPTISLLLLAYTNRFVALASIIRNLHASHQNKPDPVLRQEIASLRYRIKLIRNMQAWGAASLLFSVICILLLFLGFIDAGRWIFAVSLVMMLVSLALSLREIQLSVVALDLHLRDVEQERERGRSPDYF